MERLKKENKKENKEGRTLVTISNILRHVSDSHVADALSGYNLS